MKKIFIAIMAVAAAVSCSTELTVDAPKGAAIAFDNAFVENATRAADIDAEGIKAVGFGVTGYIVNTAGQQGKIFDNKEIAWNGSAYTYSPAQYWTAANTYTFAALVPYVDAQWEYTPTDATNGKITFNNEAAAANQDLLYSYKSETMPESIVSTPAAVEFTFNHILSRVKFSFKNGFGEGENITLKVKDVVVTNVHSNGTVAVENGAVQDWTVGTETFNRAFGNAGDGILAVGAKGTTEHFYFIPADATYNLTFVVDLYQAGVLADTYNRSANVTLTLEKGKSYELAATLNHLNTSDDGELYPIEFQVNEVDEWGAFGEGVATPTEVAKVASVAELQTALNAGQNVVLTADINLDEVSSRANAYAGLTINNDVVIDGAGHTLSTTAVRAIVVDGAKNVILKNFNLVAGNERGIQLQNNAQNVTIENVTAVSANYTVNLPTSAGAANVTINNCDLKGLNTVNVWGEGANVVINNTTLRTEDNADEGYATIYNAGKNAIVTVNGGAVVITGSKNDSYAGVLLAEGAEVTYNGTEGDNLVVKGHSYIIRYGEYQYSFATWAEAYETAKAGETIVLTQDVTLAAPIQFKKKLTLDLNGKTLKSTADDQDAIWVLTDGDLTIIGEGNVVAEESYSVYVGGTGKLTINGGNYESVISAVYAQKNAQVVINGGTFKVNDYTNSQGDSYDQTYTLNLKDGSNASILVNAGSFYKFNPAQSLSENPQKNYVAEGKTVEQDGDWYIVK